MARVNQPGDVFGGVGLRPAMYPNVMDHDILRTMPTSEGRTFAGVSSAEHRPWGRYEVLAETAEFKIKTITVQPGKRLSYQRHARRSEHWVVVQGSGTVTLDGATHPVREGGTVDVPVGAAHRIEAVGTDALVFIEVQLGEYFGEDDIERLHDDFGRAGE
jgi:mannose-6-phosphate isomerase